jgi:hypothetical protein
VPLVLRLLTPAAKIESLAALSPQAAEAALHKVSDGAKVQIAQAVPGVATVVIKDTANGELNTLAMSETHPNIVTEAQNEIDARLGPKL